MTLQQSSRCARRLRMPLLIWLGLAIFLSGAVAHPGAQSDGVNLNKPADFQIWRKITLSTYKGVDAYRRELDSAGIKIGDAADEILGRPTFSYGTMKTDVELLLVSAADLGADTDSSLAADYKRARQVGVELCPVEVGPKLRLDYRNQPLGEALDIAMEPIATYSGHSTILTLVNWGTGLALISRDGRSESRVSQTSRFVFALSTSGRLEAMRDDPQIIPTSSE